MPGIGDVFFLQLCGGSVTSRRIFAGTLGGHSVTASVAVSCRAMQQGSNTSQIVDTSHLNVRCPHALARRTRVCSSHTFAQGL